MHLYSRIDGNGHPLLILHGLFGMSDNWLTIAREIAANGFRCHIPDLRNHGRSPHSSTHRYTDMVDDLLDYCADHKLDRFMLLGHSMGGKLAMILSLLHPEMVERLVVVDMAPADYRSPANTFHHDLIDTLLAIDLLAARDRGTIRLQLEQRLDDRRLAAFLAKNITRDSSSGRFHWRCNLPVLMQYLAHLQVGLDDLEPYAPSPVPALFIKGNDSDYYLPEHDEQRIRLFPDSNVVGIDKAGHWVHSEQSAQFIAITVRYLTERD